VTANSLHPGAIRTNLGRDQGFGWSVLQRVVGLFMKSATRGARTPIYLATSADVAGVSGRYFVDCREKQPAPHAVDRSAATRLWAVSEEMVGDRYDFSALPPSA